MMNVRKKQFKRFEVSEEEIGIISDYEFCFQVWMLLLLSITQVVAM